MAEPIRSRRKRPDASFSAETGIDLPEAIVATRMNARGNWRTGSDRSVNDLHWRIRTVGEKVLRSRDAATIRFDVEVAPGLRLDDPILASERRTKVELCLDALAPCSRAGTLSALVLANRLAGFDALLRWRYRVAIPSFADLDVLDLHQFLRDTRGGTRSETSGHGPADSGDGCFDASRDASNREPNGFEGQAVASGQPGFSRSTIKDDLAVWSWLWRASTLGVLTTDHLGFDPCPIGAGSRIASAIGTPGSRTPTLSPDQFVRVLGVSSDWIGREGPAILALVDHRQAAGSAALARDPCDPGLADKAGHRNDREVASRVRHLMAACAAVIGGFAARRNGEVGALKAGCISRGHDGAYLSIYIEKTDRAVCRIPVPHSVVQAVETLEALSAGYRSRIGEPWIFNALLPGCEKVITYRSEIDLPDFAVASGLHEGRHALREPLASHQLRRGFAIAFYWAFRLGSLPALKWMLRHTELASTEIYVSEAVPGGILNLADELQARAVATMRALSADTQAELAAALERLEAAAAAGERPDRARCEGAALLLLQAWSRGRTIPYPSVLDERQAVSRRAISEVRLGSQLPTGQPGTTSLLERARAHARRLSMR